MKTNGFIPVAGRPAVSPVRGGGFSLVEILVVVGLLSIIILGLVAMFSQTQRAFRLGLTQVDVLESGRAVTDMMTRELSQMTPSRASNAVNFMPVSIRCCR